MTRSSKTLAKKTTLLLGPVFMFMLLLYLFLPALRNYVMRENLDMVSYDRGNLVIYAPDKQTSQEVWTTFRDFQKRFRKKFRGNLNLSHPRRLRIHLFRSRSDMSGYFETKYHTSLPHNAGFYDQSDQSIALSMNADQEEVNNAIRHEAVHYFLQRGTVVKSPAWSPWLNEGLASVFEHYRQVRNPDGSTEWTIPVSTVRRRFIAPFKNSGLKQFDLIPLKKFLSIPEEKFRSRGNTIYYRQASLLVYYLKERYPDAFWRYFRREKKPGRTSPSVLERMLEKDLSTLERELKQWLESVELPGPSQ